MRSVTYYTYLNILFLTLLILSGAVGGLASEGVYYLAFLAPLALAMLIHPALKRQREEIAGVREEPMRPLAVDGKMMTLTLPLVAPTVLITLGVSVGWSSLLSLMGLAAPTPSLTTPLRDAFESAFIPAILEELLFRLVPLALLLPYSPRVCVTVGALYFALAHASLFTLPYALIAGLALGLCSVCFRSIVPCLIIHLVNNLCSVMLMHYGAGAALWWILGSLIVLGIASSAILLLRRKEYIELIRGAMKPVKREGMPSAFYLYVLLTVILTLVSAV